MYISGLPFDMLQNRGIGKFTTDRQTGTEEVVIYDIASMEC
jgi:hypothetical protein